MTSDSNREAPSFTSEKPGGTVYRSALNTFITGVIILIPFVVTVYFLIVAVGFIVDLFRPIVQIVEWLGLIDFFTSLTLIRILLDLQIYWIVVGVLTELIALAVLIATVFFVGMVGRHKYGEIFVRYIDYLISNIPGIGVVYDTTRQMGDVMLGGGEENFEEITLIEWADDIYVLGFITNEGPDSVTDTVGDDDLMTVFVPFAPNPVTGGFLAYIPRERLLDIDMSMQEGLRSILTSGVAGDNRKQIPRRAYER